MPSVSGIKLPPIAENVANPVTFIFLAVISSIVKSPAFILPPTFKSPPIVPIPAKATLPFACIVAPEPTNMSPLKVDIPPTFKAPDVLFCVQ